MEIATRIQTSILPRDVTVPRLEIAATMRTATEVGGDYYDVIPVADGCWMGIGDVAGHGLGTGLVMLMMQSGIGVLARKMPDASPRELLLALNAMLVDNVRMRLGQREHATLTLLRYRQDGRLTFAGAHEEILIRRAATGRCERLETPGAWVGAKRDIEAGTVESSAQLQPGDLLVLYTDGLIEAMGRDGRERFGTDRLAALVEEHGASPPARRARRAPRRRRRLRREARRRRDAAGGALLGRARRLSSCCCGGKVSFCGPPGPPRCICCGIPGLSGPFGHRPPGIDIPPIGDVLFGGAMLTSSTSKISVAPPGIVGGRPLSP